MIALSAATAGIAIAGALFAFRNPDLASSRRQLALVFVLFAGVTTLPLIVAFARALYVFYLPMILPMFLALSPAVYFYIRARTDTEKEPSRPYWHHAALPLAGLVVALGYWLLPAAPRATMFVDGDMPPGWAPQLLALSTFILIAIWALVSFGYLMAVLKRLRIYRTKLKDLYSNTEQRELRWIDWLILILCALWVIVAATLLSDNFGPGVIFSGELVLVVTASLLLFLIAFSFTPAPARENGRENGEAQSTAPSEELDTEKATTEKYARSALSEEMASELAARIETAMRENELFLDPNLSLRKLSAHVRAAPNAVSQTLNEHLQSTFFDYVARWRIEAAKHRILTSDASVLQIAYDVGFNSRSTFYKAFKRETGMTPKSLRENTDIASAAPQDAAG